MSDECSFKEETFKVRLHVQISSANSLQSLAMHLFQTQI
jgi:hypothetical protein